jgi:hypothetical protein
VLADSPGALAHVPSAARGGLAEDQGLLVKKHLPWIPVLDRMPIEEQPIRTSGPSCNYPTVFIQVLPFSQGMIDLMCKKSGIETIRGCRRRGVPPQQPQSIRRARRESRQVPADAAGHQRRLSSLLNIFYWRSRHSVNIARTLDRGFQGRNDSMNKKTASAKMTTPLEARSIEVVIEAPKGSRNKFKYDPITHRFKLSKVLPEGMVFPHDFGFVPSTKGADGDPIDKS